MFWRDDMSSNIDEDPFDQYYVVMNHEEQYSIWPTEKQVIPLGWTVVGKPGTKQECLEYIKTVWTDMRPLSLRKSMAEIEEKQKK